MSHEGLLCFQEDAFGDTWLGFEMHDTCFVSRQDGLNLVETTVLFEEGADDGLTLGAFAFVVANGVGFFDGLAEQFEVAASSMCRCLLWSAFYVFIGKQHLTKMLLTVCRGALLDARASMISVRLTSCSSSFDHEDGGCG